MTWRVEIGLLVCLLLVGDVRAADPAAGKGAAGNRAAAAKSAERVQLVLLAPGRPARLDLTVTIDGLPLPAAWGDRLARVIDDAKLPSEGADQRQVLRICQSLSGLFGLDERQLEAQIRDRWILAADGRIGAGALPDFIAATVPMVCVVDTLGSPAADARDLFTVLDENGDESLSLDELQCMGQRLRPRDFDDDDLISREELVDDATLYAAPALAGLRDDSGSLLVLSGRPDVDRLARKLLARYDLNEDGVLDPRATPPELVALPAFWIQFDHNGDGRFDRAELTALFGQPAEVELPFTLGKGYPAVVTPSPGDDANAIKVRRKIDGGYKLHLGNSEIDFQRDNAGPLRGWLAALNFSNLDADRNGYLDSAELKRSPLLAAAGDRISRDKDGKIRSANLQSFVDRNRMANEVRIRLGVTARQRDLFPWIDVNNDGALSAREMRDAPAILSKFDQNGDGLISPIEIPTRWRVEVARGSELNYLKAGGAQERQARKSAGIGPNWFQQMDRNRDGEVSRREFLGPTAVFDRCDGDGNDVLDPVEAKQLSKS